MLIKTEFETASKEKSLENQQQFCPGSPDTHYRTVASKISAQMKNRGSFLVKTEK